MPLSRIVGVVALACAAGVAVAAVVPSWPQSSVRELAKGMFLVAKRHAGGPIFDESVVLLLDHGPGGALGVIINRPTKISLTSLLPDVEALKQRPDRAYFGGPVETDQMLLLFRASDPPTDADRVIGDIYVSSSYQGLRKVVAPGAAVSAYRAYVGYAGWAPRQLEDEVARGDWFITPADANAVFEMEPDKIWPELIGRSERLDANLRRPGDPSRSARPGQEPPLRPNAARWRRGVSGTIMERWTRPRGHPAAG